MSKFYEKKTKLRETYGIRLTSTSTVTTNFQLPSMQTYVKPSINNIMSDFNQKGMRYAMAKATFTLTCGRNDVLNSEVRKIHF